jgi:hypothetical protein
MTTRAQFCGLWIVAAILFLTGCGGSAAPYATVVVSPTQVALAGAGQVPQTQQFNATVTGNVKDLTVTWTVDSVAGGNALVGTISASGLYTPPATGGTHTITATSVALSTASASANVAVTDLPGVFTYHNDLSRDGANTQEYELAPAMISTATFGKVFSCPVDGAVYTQPLWVPGVTINGAVHNVIYVATQHDSVFAFDADANPCVQLWQASLLDSAHHGTPGEGPIAWQDVGYCYGDVYPEVGVTGTPVIDPSSNTIYMVSASEIPPANPGPCQLPAGSFFHRLHALDITTGDEKFNAPVTIAASVPGIGDGSVGGVVSFTSQLHHNRSGLALAGGTVYVPFAAHEDATPYHGWLFGYSTATSDLTVAPSVFNTTPNGVFIPNVGGADGGIWGAGGAPAVDREGNIYVATGNGVFDQGTGMSMQGDYGDSVLNLSPPATPGASMQVNGWFSPDDEYNLEGGDVDLGSGAPVLLPDQTSGPQHLLVQLGKDGVVYLINRDSMGFFNASTNQVVQYFQATTGFWGTPAFWQNNLYFAGAGDVLKQFTFDPSTEFATTASSHSSIAFGFPDVSPSVSSQGSSNGIVWAVDAGLYGYASPNAPLVNNQPFNCYVTPVPAPCTGPAILHAYNATNLTVEYWNSSIAGFRDQAGNAVKFVPPTIANGKVYVSTRTEIDVYGLLPQN